MRRRVDVKAAAKFLGVCPRTIYRHAKTGSLPSSRRKGKIWFDLEDLEMFQELPSESPTSPAAVLSAFEVRLKKVEGRLGFLAYVTGVDVTGLRDVTDAQLVQLKREAERFCLMPPRTVPLEQVHRWAETFLKISEVEMERLGRMLQERRPWAAFHRLCLSMMEDLRRRKGFSSHDKMQETYRLLERGRRSLGQAIVITTEARGAEAGPRVLQGLVRGGSVHDILHRYVKADPIG